MQNALSYSAGRGAQEAWRSGGGRTAARPCAPEAMREPQYVRDRQRVPRGPRTGYTLAPAPVLNGDKTGINDRLTAKRRTTREDAPAGTKKPRVRLRQRRSSPSPATRGAWRRPRASWPARRSLGRPQPPTEAAEECARPAFHQYSTLHLNYEVCTQIMSGC